MLRPADEVLAEIEPVALVPGRPLVRADLPPPAADALDLARRRLDAGRSFEALQALHNAERLVPDHPEVVRALGRAYVLNGNGVRGERYLHRIAADDLAETGVRILLMRLAFDRRDWPAVLARAAWVDDANARAEEPDPVAGAVAMYFRAAAMDRLGYTGAAAGLYRAWLEADVPADAATAAGRELHILRRQAGDLRARVGDLLLRLGDPEAAQGFYDQAAAEPVSDPSGLAARRVFVGLVVGDPAYAVRVVVDHLVSPAGSERDAYLAAYLVGHGVASSRLDAALADADAGVGRLAVLAARVAVLPQPQAVRVAGAWLDQRPASSEALRRVIPMLRYDAPETLVQALSLTAQAMRRHPQAAEDYLEVLLAQPIDPVVWIRALQTPAVAESGSPTLIRLAARAYWAVGRLADARAAYARALALAPGDPVLRLEAARVLLEMRPSGRALHNEAAALLGHVGPDAPWDFFQASIDLLRATEQHEEARRLLRERLAQNSGDLDLLLLDLRVRFEAADTDTDTDTAVRSFAQLLGRYAFEERFYAAVIEFGTLIREPDRGLYAPFYLRAREQLQANLPDSRLARIERVRTMARHRRTASEAVPILEALAQEDPDDREALRLLVRAYEALDDGPHAEEVRLRLFLLEPPGVRRAVSLAAYYSWRGEPQKAADLAREALGLEAEGVMPGPAMTGDQSAALLAYLLGLEDDAALDRHYRAMIRRFPDSVRLNNALSYYWALTGRELLAAEVMVRRALEQDPGNAAYLDTLAWVLYKQGRFAEAEAVMRQAILKQRQDHLTHGRTSAIAKAVYYDHLGDILYRQGELAPAVRQWVIARGQVFAAEDGAGDPEAQTVRERCAAKIQAVEEGGEPPVARVPGEAGFGPGGHPADR